MATKISEDTNVQLDLKTIGIIIAGTISLASMWFTLQSDISELQNKIDNFSGDEFVQKKGKNPIHKYDERLKNLTSIIFKKFPNSYFEISQLNNDFGPAVFEKEVQALVVSDETKNQGNILNKLRTERNLSPVEIIVVPMTLAKDGKRISTTRIKNSEIDSDGNLLPIDK